MPRNDEYMAKIDKNVGQRVYDLRMSLGLSREKIGERIGVTHQQLQKYEKGTNRISIARMALISEALGRPVSYFLEQPELTQGDYVCGRQRLALEAMRSFRNLPSKTQEAINILLRVIESQNAA